MQVYTTIYLAETICSDQQEAELSVGDLETARHLVEIKRTSLERITMLEARNWFLDDSPSED